ncbi:hypothetical protein [Microbaculum marinum]|uniref:ATP-grasp domain-containing protein n=1 Tax=Microbaculum marinum TaxID=1764581 RepID=A0AAW9RU55_9HYPH
MPNLILVHWPERQSIEDFQEIARRISARAPEIGVLIAKNKEENPEILKQAAGQPTVVVSMMELRRFRIDHATVFEGHDLPKSEQYRRYRAAGLPVPDWEVITPETKLDPKQWGDYVIVKPDLARKAAGIVIKKTGRVRYAAPESYPDDHPGRNAPMVAQKFVYTGRWANHYRITTLFGRTLFAIRCEADNGFRPLESRDGFKGAAGVGGAPVVSNKKTSHYTLTDDEEVIALGERAHSAFPEIPLLGHDIVRDADTGEVFLLESNTRGDVWLLSSGTGRSLQAANGFDLHGQFGALDVAADALIAKVRDVCG